MRRTVLRFQGKAGSELLAQKSDLVKAKLRDGREISGRRLNEDSFTIQIRDSQNRLHSLRKRDLADLSKEFGRSEMPSYESLPAAEVDDLIAYLSSLRGVR
jgi:hypothetical protein